MKKIMDSLEAVTDYKIKADRPFFSATHEEIASGATTDIYFVKTMEILRSMGLAETIVTADIFPRKKGVFAGLPEVVNLFKDADVEISAIEEGQSFEAKDVVMRIKGRYDQFGLFETTLLGMLASSSGWATAATEIMAAAGKCPVTIFGARHVHPAVAPVMERSALVGGVNGASCILGAKVFGHEPSGTAPHALFLIAGDTLEAAKAYHAVMPADTLRLILVDTFKDEAEESLRLAEGMEGALQGVRLDTPSERGGVTPALVKEVRARLDMAGYQDVMVFVSGGLTPERVAILREAGASAFGVGSYISGASPIDMTMDLKEIDGKPIAKRGRIPGLTPAPNLKKIKR